MPTFDRAVVSLAGVSDLRGMIGFDRIPLALPVAAIRHHIDPSWLAEKEMCYAGEPVAVVIAASRALAEDAASLVVLDYEELPVVTDPVAALAALAPRARLDCADNLVAQWALKYGDAERAFASAAHRIAQRFRVSGIPNFVVLKQGRVVVQQAGLVDAAQMMRWLAEA